MRVRELITLLANYNPDAETNLRVITPELDHMEPANLIDRRTADQAPPAFEMATILVDGEPTEPNAFRRGALEQLFDEASTGLPELYNEAVVFKAANGAKTSGFVKGTRDNQLVIHGLLGKTVAEFLRPRGEVKLLREMNDVELVHWAIMDGSTLLPPRMVDAIVRQTWAIQDGYGAPGVTPPQGWDWSGIRDSSADAKRKMGDVVRAACRSLGFLK